MTPARQLFSLQELDLDLDQIHAQSAGAEEELGTGVAIDQIEGALQAEADRLEEVRRLHRDQQLEADGQRERSAQLDSQLYGGAITNPRDLESLEQEASRARELLQERDAQLLELSVQEEDSQSRHAELGTQLADTQAAWDLREAELKKQIKQIAAEQKRIEGERTSLAANLESAALQQYESLRRAKGGIAVAKVERGLCQVCRMSLPTQHQQRIRNGRQTVLCSTCGRILFLS